MLWSMMVVLLVLLDLLIVNLAANELLAFPDSPKENSPLSRQKRYVIFPDGSSFSVAFCMSFKATTDDDIFTGGVNLAVSYDLPNETRRDAERRKQLDEATPVKLRRHRRELYSNLETILDQFGIDGRSCVLRTICEAGQRLLPKDSFLTEILRVLFTLPKERVRRYEPAEHLVYDSAHRLGLAEEDCCAKFPSCPLSLLDLAFGDVL